MLRMSYLKFMHDLQEETQKKLGGEFKIDLDIRIGIPSDKHGELKDQLADFQKMLQDVLKQELTKDRAVIQ